MNSQLIFRNIGRFLLLMLLQVLILNNVYLGGYINPYLYILFIAMLPTDTGKIPMIIISFCTGLCIDVSTNMLGFHTFACTLIGFMRPIWFDKIIIRDNNEAISTPSVYSGSYQMFALYLFLILFVFHLTFYLLLIFSFRDFFTILISALLSTVLTWILAIIYQTLIMHHSKNNETH